MVENSSILPFALCTFFCIFPSSIILFPLPLSVGTNVAHSCPCSVLFRLHVQLSIPLLFGTFLSLYRFMCPYLCTVLRILTYLSVYMSVLFWHVYLSANVLYCPIGRTCSCYRNPFLPIHRPRLWTSKVSTSRMKRKTTYRSEKSSRGSNSRPSEPGFANSLALREQLCLRM